MNRLDIALVQKGIIETRSKASNAIKNGDVFVNGVKISKTSFQINEDDIIEIKNENELVGRGSLKLIKAIDEFCVEVDGKRAIDIGASTGGFTQVLLDRGAREVYAVDVGHHQLDPKLRRDNRVKVYEGINARNLDVDTFNKFDIVTIDVSFISLKLILKSAYECLIENGICISLIKPQFEAGKVNLNKNGIVTDNKAHINILYEINQFASSIGFSVTELIFSPIKGGKGNIEYLVHLIKNSNLNKDINIEQIVKKAFNDLK